MTLKEAKAVRDLVKSRGPWATVPLGHKPDGYWVEIGDAGTSDKRTKFRNMAEARRWCAAHMRKRRQNRKDAPRIWAAVEAMRSPPPPRRSGIEIMIDRACGLE